MVLGPILDSKSTINSFSLLKDLTEALDENYIFLLLQQSSLFC